LTEFEMAGHAYNQVLAVDPTYTPALIGVANVYLETFRPVQAKKLLDSFIPAQAYQRAYLLAYASYHQTLGEHTEAKQIYKDLLRHNEADHEARYALGRLYDFTNEWEKAKGELAKIPPQDKMSRKARLWFGYALLHQRKFAEAAQVAAQFMQDDPNNPEGVALHVRSLSKLGQFDRAVQAGRGFLATHTRDERVSAIVRLAVGRALLEANRNMDAAREFEILLSRPAGRVPEAYYGLARAADRLGNANRAQEIIATLCGATGGDIRNRLMIADFYMMDFEPRKVLEILRGIPDYDNNNVAVLVRVADAQQRESTWSGDPAEAFATCQAIIRQSPTNVRGHLAMARSFAVAQNYRKASVQYDQLIAIDPDFTIPPRERARVLFSDNQFSACRTQYNAMLSPTPEELVMSQMGYHAQRDARVRQAFAPYMSGHLGGPALRAELARLAGSCPDEEVRLAAHRLICDYDATLAWQEAFRMERDAKELKGYRNYMAVPQYQALVQFEPSNTEAAYDLGQVYGDLRQTRAELTWYGNTLAIDPIHRDASVYSERASAEISPKLDVLADYFSQRGRTGVASIDRTNYQAAVALPIGDENEFVQVGYMRMQYNPTDDSSVWGNAPFVRAQYKFDDSRLLTWAQVNLEIYQKWFSTRPTFDVGYRYDHNDVFHTHGGLYLENVAENGESMRQDIFRYGAYCGLDVTPTRTWSFGGTATFAQYSDNNQAILATMYNDVSLSLPPKQLKLVERINLSAYRETTIFPTDPPNPDFIRGAIHPYFSPDFYATFECRIEWTHWLSRDTYVHSNQCWYSLQYGIATDENLVTYHNLRGIVQYDINSCLSIGADASTTQSSQYKMYSAMAYLQVRFLGP
jgi:tetratricopeptide (TPR) repeat protein